MRARPVAVIAASVALLLPGCSSSSDDPAVTAVCEEFSYDEEAGLGANEDRLRSLVEDAGGDPTSLGQVLSAAEEECGDAVDPYLDAAAAADEGAGEASEAPAAEDVEDPQLTEELEARGIDRGAVARLGAVADIFGVGSSKEEPLSLGASQRLASATADRCEGVAAGTTTWAAETAAIAAETGAPEAKVRSFVVYVQNHFCENLA